MAEREIHNGARGCPSRIHCQCRYQLCLFCYDRIKTECGNLCPGCRTEYGSEKDVLKKSDSRQHRNSQSGFSSTEQSPLKHSPNSHRYLSPPAPPFSGILLQAGRYMQCLSNSITLQCHSRPE